MTYARVRLYSYFVHLNLYTKKNTWSVLIFDQLNNLGNTLISGKVNVYKLSNCFSCMASKIEWISRINKFLLNLCLISRKKKAAIIFLKSVVSSPTKQILDLSRVEYHRFIKWSHQHFQLLSFSYFIKVIVC